ncbi:MAG: family N-acetyltransferase [Massilia sp.]|jgi:GNAT superfamily N-acetyltransferase|nr:family N-acetyltransferase [Massilia sp.]
MTSLKISTDRTELDVPMIYRFLSEQSTWAVGISRSVVDRAIENSMCFGGFIDGRQVVFARVVTDYATFGYLADMFVLPEYRGRGYAGELLKTILAHPSLMGLRRLILATSGAAGFYEKYGFTAPQRPETLMERYFPNIYLS